MAANVSGHVFIDSNFDGVFSPGEGLAGVTVRLEGQPDVMTDADGSYQVPNVPAGAKQLYFSGADIVVPVGVLIGVGSQDAEVDLRLRGNYAVRSSVSVEILSQVYEVDLLGNDPINATGTIAANYLVGNAADNILTGRGGDTLFGGGGSDTAVFAGPHENFRIYTSFGPTIVWDHVGNESNSSLNEIEHIRFAGVTYGLARSQQSLTSNMDGQRFDDLVFQETGTGALGYRNMQAGQPGALVSLQAGGTVDGRSTANWHVVGTGDGNSNGYADAFVQDSSDNSVLTVERQPLLSIKAATTPMTSDWAARAVADINGDGNWDVVTQNKTNGTTYLALGSPGGFASWGVVSASLTADWQVVSAGDVNFDGYADVIFQNLNAPGAPIYFANMAGGAFSGWGVVSASLTPDWRAVEVGDLNGDGYAEVIVRNQTDGTVYYADISTGAVHWGVVTTTVTSDWQVRAIADVDDDGYRDVVFQEGATGVAYYADMNAGTFAGWGVVSTNTGPGWHVV